MPSLKDIRRKISSTKNTQQITKAMKMVSAAKLRRAQQAIVNARPYAYKIHSVISRLAMSGDYTHPLMVESENPKKILLVVLTSDRGLCGAFNSSIIKFAEKFYKENKPKYEAVDFLFVGRKAAEYFKRRNVNTIETILNLAGQIRYDLAAKVADRIMNDFTSGNYDEVIVVYNEFKSAISQKVIAEKLLPIQPLTREETVNATEADIKES